MFNSDEVRALAAIEDLTMDDFLVEVEMDLANHKFRGRNKIMAERLCKIYKISHSFNKSHSCYDVHKDWRDLVFSVKV